MEKLRFWVNGEPKEIDLEPGEMLSDVLRYRLGLTGTKIACNEDECGACTVLLDGLPIFSCNFPAMKASGKRITTIEGLAMEGKLHPIQEAFVKHGAVQCGFCTPGLIMTAFALLQDNPDPSDEDIREALKVTLCRCGSYPAVIRAIQAAARSLSTEEPIGGPALSLSADTKFVGQVAVRPDAVEKVTGRAKYADDYTFPGMLYGKALRIGVSHAGVKEIDISRAKALEGVRAVLTAKDIPGERNHGLIIRDWPVLVDVDEKVRYIGDAVALVAAESREIAEQALGLIEVRYELVSVVSGPIEARKEDAPQVHIEGNLLKHIEVSKGDINQGFREAEVIIEEVYHTPIYDHAFMEPECSIARPVEGDRIEIYTGSQIPYEDKKQVAACLGLDPEKVRVIGTLIGGAFGGKEDIAGQIHAALLAQVTGCPVKVLYDRRESLLVHPKRHATHIDICLGAKRDGALVAGRIEIHGDTGAYASLGESVMTRATTHSTGPYVIPHVHADCYAMYTNNPPAGAYRGFGVLQSAFAIESAMDQLAERLGINPIELRHKNALREGTVTVTGQLLKDSVGLVKCIERVEAEIRRQTKGYESFTSQPVDGNPNLRRAWGFATAYKNTGLGGGLPDQAEAEVELYRDGTIEIRTSSAEVGQGLSLVLQMIAAEEFGVPLEKIRVLLSDTDLTPDGGPTTASRQTYISGNAVKYAAGLLHQAITVTLSEKFDCPPENVKLVGGEVHINRNRMPLGDVVEIMKGEGSKPSTSFKYTPPITQPLGEGGDMHFAFGFAAYAVEVEVDIATGEVKVLRVIAACDVGRAINPIGLLGQIEGGVMMGLGHTLTEEFIVEEGIVFTDRLALYRMPSIKHTPDIIPIIVECPTVEGPYGAKGIGEVTTIPMPAAITNAIYNACGVRINRLPVDQDWLARQIANKI